ncbi:ABC transporter ATP-binding protein [Arthrobacter oryzae]|uniref:Spermidine/putrescine import ATP-binding protein PotA n=1 Tax=Arthrobacter oryzae TaxID=409290 RepID=A0A495EVF2_9MICC|nr:ABC transporter ATP-binding protein [Arthrobacter oryzae]RKR20097.1 spermidine/putrescine ABC transporter ATP-binding subunit [Arthrobacter oryzae]
MIPGIRSERGTVELTGVVRRFGDVPAVDGINLTVRPGEFLSLLGPSGCGKTTTLRMIAGFEYPDEGIIRISGQAVQETPAHRRDVNTVFQAYALFPHMTVAENIAYGLRQKRASRTEVRKQVAEALEMVQLAPLANRKPQQLSGGQQQRVALARAIINRPSVLLLDEPLAALDRQLREKMQIELKLLQHELQMTFIFVTHDQGEAMSMSDRIAVMAAGRIEQLADPFTIYDAPASAFVAGFIGRQNFFHGRVQTDGTTLASDRLSVRSTRTQPGLAPGAEGMAAVRPESMTISEQPPVGDDNHVRGVLINRAHLGSTVQYIVDIGGRHEVIVECPPAGAPAMTVGSSVYCCWSPSKTYLFDSPESVSSASDSASLAEAVAV